MEEPMEEPPHQDNIATEPNNLQNTVNTNAQLIATLMSANKKLTKINNNLADQLKQSLNNNKTMVAVVKNMSTTTNNN